MTQLVASQSGSVWFRGQINEACRGSKGRTRKPETPRRQIGVLLDCTRLADANSSRSSGDPESRAERARAGWLDPKRPRRQLKQLRRDRPEKKRPSIRCSPSLADVYQIDRLGPCFNFRTLGCAGNLLRFLQKHCKNDVGNPKESA